MKFNFVKGKLILLGVFLFAGTLSCELLTDNLGDSRFNGKFVYRAADEISDPQRRIYHSYTFDGTSRASFFSDTEYSYAGNHWWREDDPSSTEYEIKLEGGNFYQRSWDDFHDDWHDQGVYSFDGDDNLSIGRYKYEKED